MEGHVGHAHHHRHRMGERRRVWFVVLVTASVLVLEVGGGLASHSLALLSDAGHMLSDLGAQVLSLLALAIAARPSDDRRTYGYHRVEILAALMNGLVLMALSVWIIWSAVSRLASTSAAVETRMMIGVATIGLGANLLSAWLLHGAQSLNVRGAYLHVLYDSVSSVAVLLGGGAMALHKGWYFIDPIASIGIGLFVIYSAYRLVRDAVDVLLETVPGGIDSEGVSRAMAGCTGVLEVHDLHIWTITSGMYALSAHLVVERDDLEHTDSLLTEVKGLLLERFHIDHSTLQIESRAYEHVGHTCPTTLSE